MRALRPDPLRGRSRWNPVSLALEITLVITIVSSVSLVAGIVLLPLVVVYLPEDHFVREPGGERWKARTLGRRSWAIARTALGGLLVLTGIVLLVLPGQGLLTIVAGLLVAEYPGKYRIERAVVRRPSVLAALNEIRRRFDRAPLRLDGEGHHAESGGDDRRPPAEPG